MVTPSFSIGTGLTLGGLILAGKAVSVYENNQEILTDVILQDAEAADDAQTMDHPLENGALVTDHIVFNPNKVTLRCWMPNTPFLFDRALREIQNLYRQSREVTIKIRSDVFEPMIMIGKPVKVGADNLDHVVYELSFKQILKAVSQYVPMPAAQVKHKQDASTVSSGEKQPQSSSLLLKGFRAAGAPLGINI